MNRQGHIERVGSLVLELEQARRRYLPYPGQRLVAQRYAELYDFAPVGFCTVDIVGTIVEINRAGAALFGLERASLLDRPIRTIVSSVDYDLLSTRLRSCIERFERHRLEMEVITRAKRRLILDVQIEPLLDDTGTPSAALLTLVDITRRKNAEEAMQYLVGLSKRLSSLLASGEVLSTIAEALVPFPASACVATVQDSTTPELHHGVAIADSEKAPLLEHLVRGQHLLLSVKRGLQVVLREGKSILIHSVPKVDEDDPALRSWTGELDLSSFALLPLSVGDKTVGTLSLGRASSMPSFHSEELPLLNEVARRCAAALENVRLYEAALRAIRIRDEFVAIVSHDLTNTVTALGLTSSGPANTGAQVERRKRGGRSDWRRVQRAAQWMQHLIQRLLDISVIESGHLSISARPEPAIELLDSVFEIVEVAAAAKKVSLKRQLSGRIWVMADKERIQQALSNLIINAIKFSPRGATVTVGVEKRDGVLFSVIDQGPGISAEDQKHIFDRFWQAKQSQKAGVGLGLAIARGIILAHGGELWVESEVGRGSTFRFSLAAPIRVERRRPRNGVAPKRTKDSAGGPRALRWFSSAARNKKHRLER